MPSLLKPSPEKLQRILNSQAELAFTYPGVGTTKTEAAPPANYAVDHNRAVIGQGSTGFERARTALARWRQFRLGWLEAFPDNTPIRAGETVVVLARVLGMWWTNAARIVYTIDETEGALARFGFAYGTLPGHVESGEERFLVEWDRNTDQVWFDILAFSRPRHFLTRLGHRHARAMQKQFAQQSTAAMQSAVTT
jgi:uncharacterized protein (UPF0548 family)